MAIVRKEDREFAEVTMEGVAGTTKATVIGPAEGWKANALRVFRISPGGFTPHHQHDWEHVNYIINGKGTLTIGGETFELKAGDYVFVPPNTMHQFKNPFGADFEFICIVPERGA